MIKDIRNPSNCECECDKSCDFGEYLDYENCKCRKRLIDKLVDECDEYIDEEVKILDKNKNESKCSFWIVYVVLFWIFFAIIAGIVIFYVYSQWYLKKYFPHVNFNNYKKQ